MTLSQTYISRKQLLVDNLVAKGVTGYTVNDGLTTLINAVLEIQGGGGVRTLTLTSNKDILSYADSESATLTATLLEDGVAVSGATVEFFNGSTSLGTAQTDSNGVATKIYTSTGEGDVSLKAEADNGMLVSEIYEVQDCNFFDASSQENSRKYTVGSRGAFSYDSTNNAYLLRLSSQGFTSLILSDYSFANSCEYSVDVKFPSTLTANIQFGTGLSNGTNIIAGKFARVPQYSAYQCALSSYKISDGEDTTINTQQYNFEADKWYTFDITYNNGSVTFKLYLEDTLIQTITGSESILGTNNSIATILKYTSNTKVLLKNIKVKPL